MSRQSTRSKVLESLQRLVGALLLDLPVVLVLLVPAAGTYLQWPLLCLYLWFSALMFHRIWRSQWILTIVRDPRTRVCHGLEHATMTVLEEADVPAVHGFTHGRDRFMIAVKTSDTTYEQVLAAATRAIQRIQLGERSLAYHPGCGTSDLISAVTLWCVLIASFVVAFLLGGSGPVTLAIIGLVLRFGLALQTGFGLLAQRLFTVSTSFDRATVLVVRDGTRTTYWRPPESEIWFEVVIGLDLPTSEGGLVSPGSLP